MNNLDMWILNHPSIIEAVRLLATLLVIPIVLMGVRCITNKAQERFKAHLQRELVHYKEHLPRKIDVAQKLLSYMLELRNSLSPLIHSASRDLKVIDRDSRAFIAKQAEAHSYYMVMEMHLPSEISQDILEYINKVADYWFDLHTLATRGPDYLKAQGKMPIEVREQAFIKTTDMINDVRTKIKREIIDPANTEDR